MHVLILKLGATGDVVRTTSLLRRFDGQVTWITAPKNVALLKNTREGLRTISWDDREQARGVRYALVINLEDDLESAQFAKSLDYDRSFGAYVGADNQLRYTEDARCWFDLSLISTYGRREADRLKLQNRQSYQELIFRALGLQFNGERYFLPETPQSELTGDIAIATEAGPVWPMKKWAYYGELKIQLEARGLVANYLPKRNTLLEHLADVRGHRCLVSGDSLPMHLALGSGIRCVSIFTCTSPWEIHDYGIQTKLVSPLLEQFFYKRDFDVSATTAITLEQVLEATLEQVSAPVLA